MRPLTLGNGVCSPFKSLSAVGGEGSAPRDTRRNRVTNSIHRSYVIDSAEVLSRSFYLKISSIRILGDF